MRHSLPVYAGLALVIISIAACRPYEFTGTYLDQPKPITNFTIATDDSGEFRYSELGDRFLVIYFGYTHCPDICPTTLAEIDQAMEALGDDADQFQVAMLTVDPERDTADQMSLYLDHFDEAYLGLREDDPDKLAALLADFGVFAQKDTVEEGNPQNYTVSHTSSVFVIDQSGLRLLIPYGTPGETIARDLRQLFMQQ